MTIPSRPYSEACVRNREPILEVLRRHLVDATSVLEIGSGTGQHAAYFATQLPQLRWQTSDLQENHEAISAWLAAEAPPGWSPPIALDVCQRPWPAAALGPFDAVYTANTCHIMSWQAVEAMFLGIDAVLAPGGRLLIYGPFNYGGDYTSESNRAFDGWLKARDPRQGIRDFEAVARQARAIGLELVVDQAMPANNRTLVWRRG